MTSLYYRCLLESDSSAFMRTVDRSMIQAESLLKDYNDAKAPVARRMDLFFVSGMRPIWRLEEKWANIMFSLGSVKRALEVFTKLGLWEEVIICYNMLNFKHKVCIFYIEYNTTKKYNK